MARSLDRRRGGSGRRGRAVSPQQNAEVPRVTGGLVADLPLPNVASLRTRAAAGAQVVGAASLCLSPSM